MRQEKYQLHCSQQGSILLEYMVVLLLSFVATIWALEQWADKKASLQLEAKALWMQALQQATERYIETYGHLLSQSPTNAMVEIDEVFIQNWQEPSLLELQQLGLLSPAFAQFTVPPARVWVFEQTPCWTEPCFLHALIVANEPLLTADGVADAFLLDHWRTITKGAGLTVQAPFQHWLASAHLRWPNEFAQQGPLPEGSIALAVQGEQLWQRYLRVGDERDPAFRNHVTVGGRVHSDTALSSQGYIALAQHAVPGESCPEVGALAHHANIPALLVCRAGQWQLLLGNDGGHFVSDLLGQCFHPQLGSTTNPVTGSCGCPANYFAVVFSLFSDTNGTMYRSHICRPRQYRY